jgi:hypothetical protein
MPGMDAHAPVCSVDGLRRVVVKDGVRLGGLPTARLPWARGCVWGVLPAHTMGGPQVKLA